MVTIIKRGLLLGREVITKLNNVLKRRDITLPTKVYKGLYSQSYGFSSSHVWIWKVGHKEGWALKNWCFQIVVLEKTLEGHLDSKKFKPVNPKENQFWIFIGRTVAAAEAPILWPPDVKSLLIGKDPDAEKDWRQEEQGATEEEMVGWHHRFSGQEFKQTLGDGEGQGNLACCSPWSWKESDRTEHWTITNSFETSRAYDQESQRTTENFALKQHTNRLTLIKFQSRGNRLKKKKSRHSSQPVKTISAPQPMLSSSSILTPHHVGSPQCIREEAPGHSELQLQSLVSRQPYQCGSHQCTQKQPDTCWALNLDHPDKVKQACSCFSSSPSTKAIGHIQSA